MKVLDYSAPEAGPTTRSRLISITTGSLLLALAITISYGLVSERWSRAERGKVARLLATKTDVMSLELAVRAFEQDIGRIPTETEGLAILMTRPIGVSVWNGPYLERNIDPWSNPYVYHVTKTGFRIVSKGPDQVEGTSDDIGTQPAGPASSASSARRG